MNKAIGKPSSVKFLVASGNQALATSGSIFPSSGTSVGLVDGQLGIVSWDDSGVVNKGSYLTATNGPGSAPNEADDVKSIKIVQGTPNSADISQLNEIDGYFTHVPYMESDPINADSEIHFVGTAAATPLRSAWLATGFRVNDYMETRLNLSFHGRSIRKQFGVNNTDMIVGKSPSVDYATLGFSTDAEKTNYINQNLVYELNRHSRVVLDARPMTTTAASKPFVAFGVDVSGGSGTAISALSAGTPVNFMVRNGITVSYTPDAQFIATITEAVANSTLTTSSTIEVVNLTNANAGTGTVDGVLIVALDPKRARVADYEPSTKVSLTLTGNDSVIGFATLTEASKAYEGQGQGKWFRLKYEERAKSMQGWTKQWHGSTLTFLDSANYVQEGQEYNVFTITHGKEYQRDTGVMNKHNHVTHILVPSTSGASAANTLAGLNAVLAPWLNSCSKFTKDTPATAPSLFV